MSKSSSPIFDELLEFSQQWQHLQYTRSKIREIFPYIQMKPSKLLLLSFCCLRHKLLVMDIHSKGYWSITMDDLRDTRGAFCM